MSNSELQISIQTGYILVERPLDYEVVWTKQQEVLKEISAFCEETNCRKVLVLGPKTKVTLSTVDIFRLGEIIAGYGLRIAVVEVHDATEIQVDFLETVVANRGGPLQFFDNKEDAKDWLGIT